MRTALPLLRGPLLCGTALVALALGLAPGGALADAALVLGNESYDPLPSLPDGDAVAGSTAGLAALGFDVEALADGGREDASRLIARFMAEASDAERLVVALSGRFATDGRRSWFLTADSPVPTLFGLNSNAVSVESVLAVLARRPSRAMLLLGVDPETDGAFDPWLREGLGDLEIPQGVTVLSATPEAIAAFMADELARPEGDLAGLVTANPDISADGYLPQGFAFMPPEPEPEPVVAEEPEVAAAEPASGERALWAGALALDTMEAYRDYLRAYPEGLYASEARAAVATILSEPDRAARIEEESLRLTRAERRQVQADLAALDFDPRGVDGVFGAGTRAAVVNWQQQNGYPQTSYLDAEQVARLSEQVAEREAATAATLRAQAQADDDHWARTGAEGGIDGLRAYLERYPDGRHAEEAADSVALLEAAGREQAEEEAWARARRANTEEGFARFLDAWPRGAHVEDARSGLSALRDGARAAQAGARAEREDDAQRREAREAETELGLTPLTARVIEARLRALGLDPGDVDGELDGRAREAIRGYQGQRDLPATGFLDQRTVVRLLADTLGEALQD